MSSVRRTRLTSERTIHHRVGGITMSATAGTLTATPTHTFATARSTWRVGITASVVAAIATQLFVVLAHALGVSLKVGAPGANHAEEIPMLAFAQWALIWSLVGTGLAVAFSRWARRPAHTFTVTAIVLTVVSFAAPVTATHTGLATKLVLAASHVVAAAIVIPALARQLPQTSVRRAERVDA
jgi:hypothetical protein